MQLHPPGVVGQQRLERVQIVALHEEILRRRITRPERGVAMQQAVRQLPGVVHHGALPDPIEGGHPCAISQRQCRE